MIKDFKLFCEENLDNKFRVFCDMDGVLTDFNNGFKKLNTEGLGPKEYEQEYGKNKIWPLISDQGSLFWSNLEWMSDGKELWNYLQQYTPTILSSPSREYSSIIGKMTWINSNLGITQRKPVTRNKDWDKDTKIILSSHKHLFVIPGTVCILIDDTPSKIEKWESAGGIGILHTNTVDTLSRLNAILDFQ
jgi:hypothetical protein